MCTPILDGIVDFWNPENSPIFFFCDNLMSEPITAESLKEKGNETFKKRDYETAIDFYSKSIAIEPSAAW